MKFRAARWYPIAVGLSVLNFLGIGFALRPAEPLHAATHAVLALAFGYWALRLRQDTGAHAFEARLEFLEGEMQVLRHELNETQERLDFAERVLAQGPEGRRVGPEHQGPG